MSTPFELFLLFVTKKVVSKHRHNYKKMLGRLLPFCNYHINSKKHCKSQVPTSQTVVLEQTLDFPTGSEYSPFLALSFNYAAAKTREVARNNDQFFQLPLSVGESPIKRRG